MYVDNLSTRVQEADLVELVRQRNRKGFARLYDYYASALYGVVMRIVKSDEVAQEVLQDVFVKIWQNIQRYDADKGTLFTWMLNIARNTAIDCVRSQSYRWQQQNQGLETQKAALKRNVTHIPIEAIGLQKVIAVLRPEHQEIIEHLYFKGYTQSEAAEILGLPLGTVKTRIKIALRELRKLLDI